MRSLQRDHWAEGRALHLLCSRGWRPVVRN